MANVIDFITRHAAAAPQSVAVRIDGDTWSYAQLRDAALAFGAGLQDAGIAPGDRVLLAVPTVAEFYVAYLAIQAVGAIAVPVNTMSTAAEVAYYLREVGCSRAIAWHALGPAVQQAATAVGIPFQALPAMTPGNAVPAGARLAEVVDRGMGDTAAILFTSGTTGKPKGAQLTVGNITSGAEIGAGMIGMSPADRVGTALPLFHVFGQVSTSIGAFAGGCSVSLLTRFDPVAMIEMLRRDRLTIMAGVPTMWTAMLHAASDARPEDFASLRCVISGGASLPGEVARAFQAKFGCIVLEGYGLTETTAYGTFNRLEKGPKIGYVGSAIPRCQVEVRDADDKVCPPRVVGEVYIKGPVVTPGYWNRPDATAEVLHDGWFRTGDLGETDEEGDLRIVDRAKDLIIRGGYNVYPGEVEEVLYQLPQVVEAAVVGVPDQYYGEEVAAVLVIKPGMTLDAAAVEAWARERLSAYKIPRIVQFVDALPKGASGKILKRAIDRAALRRLKPEQPSATH